MKVYKLLVTLVACLFLSACSNPKEELAEVEREMGELSYVIQDLDRQINGANMNAAAGGFAFGYAAVSGDDRLAYDGYQVAAEAEDALYELRTRRSRLASQYSILNTRRRSLITKIQN